MIKSTVIPAIARSFSESSDGDAKPAKMNVLAETKPEPTSSKPSKIMSFYALYSLKLNR